MHDVDVIDEPLAAVVALDPIRARMLAALATPQSATTLATQVGLTRQKVNYHLRLLERHGLVTPVEQRRWGGLTERFVVATAASYVVSPAAMGAAGSDPSRAADRLSARYLIALAARVVREVGALVRRADEAGQQLPTLSLDTEVHLRTPDDRDAFTHDLAAAVTDLVTRYSHPGAGSRGYRVVVAAHPIPKPDKPDKPDKPGTTQATSTDDTTEESA
jgi:DNA-binding transcriptional ArsR family regulator